MVRWTKALSLVLAFAMMLGLIPFNMNANADGEETITVQWVDSENKVLDSANINKGEAPVYNGPLPTKATDEAHISLFVGWSGYNGSRYYASFPKLEQSTTFKAEFDELTRDCAVVFVSEVKNEFGGYDIKEIARKTYDYNTAGGNVVPPANPTKEPDLRYTYIFAGWELDEGTLANFQTVKGDTVYRANFVAQPRTYTITWKNESGAILSAENVLYGATPTYASTPAKAADGTYRYEFAGWQPAVTPVVGDATYTATYKAIPLTTPDADAKFNYSFLDAEGTPIKAGKVAKGGLPTAPAEPAKADDEQYSYAFAGWLPAVAEADCNVTYVPQYIANERTYTVRWMNGETVLSSKSGLYSAMMAELYVGDAPTREDTQQYKYVFAGWKTSVSKADGLITKAAQFVTVSKKYPVAFLCDSGTVYEVARFAYDTMPKTTTDPVKPQTAQYTYKFTGWSPAVEAVTGSAVYTATFQPKERNYNVIFKNWDGTALDSGIYPYSTPLSEMNLPTATKPSGGGYDYVFNGYAEVSVDEANGIKIYQATFIQYESKYTVSWLNYDGTVLETDENVSWHGSFEYNGEPPTRPMTDEATYTFDTWVPADTYTDQIEQNRTYQAKFTATTRKYTITWMDGETLLGVSEVPYGDTPVYPSSLPAPEKAMDDETVYTFEGDWEPALAPVTKDATYNAKFKSADRLYTITFTDQDGGNLPQYTMQRKWQAEIPYFEPVKAEDAQYTYKFEGWERGFDKVSGNATYKANFGKTLKQYTVTWLDGDSDPIETEKLNYGAMPVYSGSTPTKSKTNDTVYTWNNSWTPTPVPVTGDATYTATFTGAPREYTITWMNGDGTTVLDTDTVHWHDMPSYTGGITPTKTHTDPGKFWSFKTGTDGWNSKQDGTGNVPQLVEGDATYYAQFEEVDYFKVNWQYPDPEDNLNDKSTVPENVTPGNTVAKPAGLPYPDKVWVDKDTNVPYDPVVPPTKNTTYVPVFKITWDNPDPEGTPDPTANNVVDEVPYLNPVTQPANGLDPNVTNWTEKDDPDNKPFVPNHPAIKDETYIPLYKIIWDDPDKPDDQDPKKDVPADESIGTPAGLPDYPAWVDKDTKEPFDPTKKPEKDTTFVPAYVITWETPTGPVEQYVPANEQINKPTDDLPDSVKNVPNGRWKDPDKTPFTPHPATKNETFSPYFVISWKPNNTADPDYVDKTDTVKLGETPSYGTTNPTKPSNNFSSWKPEKDTTQSKPYPADKDETYVAQYTPRSSGGGGGGGGGSSTPKTVKITWVVGDDKTVTNVPIGTTPSYNGTPKKGNATFIRWTPTIVPATKDATYTAVFNDSDDYRATPDVTGIVDWLETGEHIIYYRGYPDKSIRPYGNITRAETAMILYRLLKDKNVPITVSFSDVKEGQWYTEAILTIASLGISKGYVDGTFHPDQAITRAEFTAMCIHFIDAVDAKFEFKDVPENYWAYKEIMTAAYYGWIDGYMDGTFRPNVPIARCEAAAVVNRMLGRVADKNFVDAHESELIPYTDLKKEWYYYEMIEGTNAHDYDTVNGVETWKSMYDK